LSGFWYIALKNIFDFTCDDGRLSKRKTEKKNTRPKSQKHPKTRNPRSIHLLITIDNLFDFAAKAGVSDKYTYQKPDKDLKNQ
jgi:hypothetical protein